MDGRRVARKRLLRSSAGRLPVPAMRKSEASQRFWEVCARNFAQ